MSTERYCFWILTSSHDLFKESYKVRKSVSVCWFSYGQGVKTKIGFNGLWEICRGKRFRCGSKQEYTDNVITPGIMCGLRSLKFQLCTAECEWKALNFLTKRCVRLAGERLLPHWINHSYGWGTRFFFLFFPSAARHQLLTPYYSSSSCGSEKRFQTLSVKGVI